MESNKIFKPLLLCPRCQAPLKGSHYSEEKGFWFEDPLQCTPCKQSYPVRWDIPDLRGPGRKMPGHLLDWEDDLALAGTLEEASRENDFLALFSLANKQSLKQLEDKGWGKADTRYLQRLRDHFKGKILQALSDPGFRSPERILSEACGTPCAGNWPQGPALDIGCGSGINLLAMAPSFPFVIGVDIAFKNLILCKNLLKEHKIRNFCLVAADARRLPLGHDLFSLIYLIDVLEHLSHPGELLQELNRVVQPGGWIYLTTPNRYSFWKEPHTRLWGLGWLPQRLQASYARARNRVSFQGVRLYSYDGLYQLLQPLFRTKPLISLDYFPDYGPWGRSLKQGYKGLGRKPVPGTLLKRVTPVLELLCTRQENEEHETP